MTGGSVSSLQNFNFFTFEGHFGPPGSGSVIPMRIRILIQPTKMTNTGIWGQEDLQTRNSLRFSFRTFGVGNAHQTTVDSRRLDTFIGNKKLGAVKSRQSELYQWCHKRITVDNAMKKIEEIW